MRMLETILAPIAFGPNTNDVLRYAGTISHVFGSSVILQTVLSHSGARNDVGAKTLLDMARAGAETRLEECRRQIEMHGGKVAEVLVDVGIPSDEIIHRADERDINVVILGAASDPDRSSGRLGATADNVRQYCLKPVCLVKPGRRHPPESILCPVDFSRASERALRNAIHLSRQFSARLNIVLVVPPLAGWSSTIFGVDEAAERDQIDSQTKRFDEFIHRFDFHDIDWEKVVRQGDPTEQILDTARSVDSDLVIMGSSGRTGLWEMFAGSVTDTVANQAPCSVLTMIGDDAIRLRVDEELTDIETHYARGQELLEQGFPEEARRQFEHCVNINDMFVPAWESLAKAYDRLGQPSRQQECLAMAQRVREALSWTRIEAEIRASHPLWKRRPSGL